MKIKVLAFGLMLSLAAILGACEGGSEPADTTATPPAGEPADSGAVTPEAVPTETP